RDLRRALLTAGDGGAGRAARADLAVKERLVLLAGNVVAEDIADDTGLHVTPRRDAGSVADLGRVLTNQVVGDVGLRPRHESDACPLIANLFSQAFLEVDLQSSIADDD